MNENSTATTEAINNRMLLTENDLLKLVHAMGMTVVNLVSIKCQMDVDNGRRFIECCLYGAGPVEYGQMMVDYKRGQPSVEQVYTLAYGLSANCRHKIILFTDENWSNDLDDPGADLSFVCNEIKILNRHGAQLYLVEIAPQGMRAPTYNILEEADFSIARDLPDERIVRNDDFWDLYFFKHYRKHRNELGIDFRERYNDTMDYTGLLSSENFSVLSYWDKKGLSYYMEDRTIDNACLCEIYDEKRRKLQALFPDYGLSYMKYINKYVFRVNNEAIDSVLFDESEAKKETGRKLWTEMNRILQFLEKAVKDIEIEKLTTPHGLLRI